MPTSSNSSTSRAAAAEKRSAAQADAPGSTENPARSATEQSTRRSDDEAPAGLSAAKASSAGDQTPVDPGAAKVTATRDPNGVPRADSPSSPASPHTYAAVDSKSVVPAGVDPNPGIGENGEGVVEGLPVTRTAEGTELRDYGGITVTAAPREVELQSAIPDHVRQNYEARVASGSDSWESIAEMADRAGDVVLAEWARAQH